MLRLHRLRTALPCALLCLCLLTSCGGGDPLPEETSAETPTETTQATTEQTAPPAPAIGEFIISRPDGDNSYLPALEALSAAIRQKTGAELRPASDLVIAGRPEPAYEILLGKTRRTLSQELYESLPLGGYAVVYKDGKIALAGRGDEPLQAAIDYFLEHYFSDGALILPDLTDFRGQYEYKSYHAVLEGKSINVMGDSYVSDVSLPDGKIWPRLLAEKYEMDYRSYGISGNAIASPEASGTPMVQRYSSMRGGVDIVFVVGGRNDYNHSYPVGQVGDTTTDTYCGAVAVLIDGLRAKYPNSLILFSTSWYVNDDMEAYNNATWRVCQMKGIPCFHAANQSLSGVYMNRPSFREMYCVKPNDVSHLNASGMKLVLPTFEEFIASEAEKFFK